MDISSCTADALKQLDIEFITSEKEIINYLESLRPKTGSQHKGGAIQLNSLLTLFKMFKKYRIAPEVTPPTVTPEEITIINELFEQQPTSSQHISDTNFKVLQVLAYNYPSIIESIMLTKEIEETIMKQIRNKAIQEQTTEQIATRILTSTIQLNIVRFVEMTRDVLRKRKHINYVSFTANKPDSYKNNTLTIGRDFIKIGEYNLDDSQLANLDQNKKKTYTQTMLNLFKPGDLSCRICAKQTTLCFKSPFNDVIKDKFVNKVLDEINILKQTIVDNTISQASTFKNKYKITFARGGRISEQPTRERFVYNGINRVVWKSSRKNSASFIMVAKKLINIRTL